MMMVYNAIVRYDDRGTLKKIADEYYEGDLKSAMRSELGWVEESGITIEVLDRVTGHPEYLEKCFPKRCAECRDAGVKCKLDMNMPCSPDCEGLDPDTGKPSGGKACEGCDARPVYKATIKTDAKELERFNKLLDMENIDFEKLGIEVDSAIHTFTAEFPNGYMADIKVCSGQTNCFVDPVLFNENGAQVCVLEPADELDGVYEFEAEGVRYIVEVVSDRK